MGEECHNPVLADDHDLDLPLLEVGVQIGHLLVDKSRDDFAVIVEAWQLAHVHGFEMVVIQQPDGELERQYLTAVEVETGDDIVESLSVAGARRVLAQSVQDGCEYGAPLALGVAEERLFRVRAGDIHRYLPLISLIASLPLHSFVELQALLVVHCLVGPVLDAGQPLFCVAAQQELPIETIQLAIAVGQSFSLANKALTISAVLLAVSNYGAAPIRCRNVDSVSAIHAVLAIIA